MKKIIFLALLSINAVFAFAQQQFVISASAGINNPSSSVKNGSYLGNGYNVQANVFMPFMRTDNGRFALGILAGGTYFTTKNLIPDTGNLKAAYKLYSGNLDIDPIQNGKTTNSGISGYLGVQADFSCGPLILSPSVSGGYFSLQQKGFAQTATIPVNGTRQTIPLSDLPETKRTGFVTIPRLQISCPLTNSFSVYTSGEMAIGPKMSGEQRQLEPAGGFNSNNTYEPMQLSSGKMIATSAASTNYQALMLNVGVSWSLGRKLKNRSTMPSRLSMTPTTAKQTQGSTFGEKVSQGLHPAAAKTTNPLYKGDGTQTTNPLAERAMPGQPIKGVIVKGGKNPGGNLLAAVTNEKGEFELNGLEMGVYQFTLEIPDEPQAKGIGTDTGKNVKPQPGAVSSSYAAMVAGQPIGGITVKGGKNPGGSMIRLSIDSDGKIEFEVLEAGNYKFSIQTPENANDNGRQGKKEKVKEKATSGLKDTLKTQV